MDLSFVFCLFVYLTPLVSPFCQSSIMMRHMILDMKLAGHSFCYKHNYSEILYLYFHFFLNALCKTQSHLPF